MAFSLRDFCEPGDEYVNFATGEREAIEECAGCEGNESAPHTCGRVDEGPKPTERWHIVLTDHGAISGQIEWHSRTIADAAWWIHQAWGKWCELPEQYGDVLLSDALIARVYDTTKDTEAPAYELMPHTKRDAIVRRRPRY